MYCTPMISPLCPFPLLSALRLCVYVLCVPGIESVDVYLLSCVHYTFLKVSSARPAVAAHLSKDLIHLFTVPVPSKVGIGCLSKALGAAAAG
jgi:hypothetical protein